MPSIFLARAPTKLLPRVCVNHCVLASEHRPNAFLCSGEAVAVGGQSNEIVVESGPDGLDEAQVRERFAGSEQIKLLHIKGMDGSSFDGFEHPVTQLYFDKAARRGIKESFLARHAANRIMQTFVGDSSCPALILPREGSHGTGECGAMCIDEVARALSGAGLKSDCLVVLAGSLTGNDRGIEGMGKALDPLRRLFGKVMWIGEGELDFPVCDLWRLGSHYMLNWMELLIAVDMNTLIAVKPRGDDALDPMVQEALQQRFASTVIFRDAHWAHWALFASTPFCLCRGAGSLGSGLGLIHAPVLLVGIWSGKRVTCHVDTKPIMAKDGQP